VGRIRIIIGIIGVVFIWQAACQRGDLGPPPALAALPAKQEVIAVMQRVNDFWIDGHPDPGDNGWARATYFEGNMAMYGVYSDRMYYDYAVDWAQLHSWELIGGDSTRNADNQCAGQTYLDLYNLDPSPEKIEHIQASIDAMVASGTATDWWWIDALQMAMPVFVRFGTMYSDTDYYDEMWDLYSHTKYTQGGHGLYSDNGYHAYGDYLWWRDASYDPPAASPNGDMIYWSRGNGWVIVAHVRTLHHLPDTDPHYNEYLQTFQDMAASLGTRQRSDGFWDPNLDDPDHCGGKETSGTAFFTYALAWGINNGFLDEATYRPVVEKAWNGMVNDAVHQDGKLGYVQASAAEPCAHNPIEYEDTTDFGVGAFLLAGSEVVKMADGLMPDPGSGTWYSAGNFTAVHELGTENFDRVTVEFDVIPLGDNIDGVIGYADASAVITGWSDMAISIRMFTNGMFEVRNGDVYSALNVVPYSAGNTYHVKMVAGLDAGSYEVWVTPHGGSQTQIADDYAFRSDAPATDDIGKVCLKSIEDRDFRVRNHTVGSTCTGDFDADFDVDGADLAELIKDSEIPDLSFFAARFGRNDCP
jgi:unsaturated rhamnogalacturonyl hydrolase